MLFASCMVAALAAGIDETRTWEEMVECRDGVKLHARIVLPKDYEGKQFTTVMDRSPYGYDDLEWMSDLFVPAGFAAIGQDMRGTKLSEGNFTLWHGDANDSEDLGNWIVQQPWSNGKIFNFGASADGLAAFTTNYNQPAWLQSQYIIWSSALGYEVIYPNGAVLYNLVERWIRGTVREDEIESNLATIYANEMYNAWWEPIDMKDHFDLVNTNSGFWAGWYDIFLTGNLASFEGFQYKSQPEVQGQSLILVDPCGHCQDAAQYFTEDLIAGRTILALMQAYQVYGVRPVSRTNIKAVTFYVMSSNDDAGKEAGQFWTTMDAFPQPSMTKFYLHSDLTATTTPPAETEDDSSSSFVADPADPVPTNGGANLFLDCGPLDQAEIDTRSDVLSFQTPVMDEELPLTGPINGYLYVSSDAIDTDVMVRVSDVYPTGEARLIQDSAVRMRWRNGGEVPQYMEKGTVYPAFISLWNTSYVVAPGHALRFAVSSSNYPRFSLNPNNGLLLSDPAYPGENITATNAIHHSAAYPSYIELPVVEKQQLPKVHNVRAEWEAAYPDIPVEHVVQHGQKAIEMLTKSRRQQK